MNSLPKARTILTALAFALVAFTAAPAQALPKHDQALMQTARNLTSAQLKYPETARFQNLFIVFGTDGSRIVCGYVSGKSDLGNYGKYIRFLMFHGASQLELEVKATNLEEVQYAATFNFTWETFCKRDTI